MFVLLEEVKERFKIRSSTNIIECDNMRSLVTGQFLVTATMVVETLPPGREQSLALTKLEESWLHSLSAFERRYVR
jgi:hypothetical protein